MSRLIRIGASFATVLVAYWAYALVAVPLIEPPADSPSTRHLEDSQGTEWVRESRERWRKELEGLFPSGAWELKDPKILASDQAKLLFQGYRRIGAGREVEIRPCTIVFTPDGQEADPERRKRRSVILEAPQGALLEFDQPFNLGPGKAGRLAGGKLIGQIKIRSAGESPGPEDDLEVTTRDVDLNEERIWTPHAVAFRLGPNHGRGSQMRIKLLSGEEGIGAGGRGPDIAGIELFEVLQLDALHLELDDESLSPGSRTADSPPAKSADSGLQTGLPIEVTCRGPFRFDPIQQVATFEDQVDVKRLHPNGPSDQLNCEKLSVYFARPRKPAAGEAQEARDKPETARPPGLDLQPRRIEAVGSPGNPVVVWAPSRQLHVHGERLEWDLYSRRIELGGSQEVFLKQAVNEIHARSLQYELAESGRLGQIVAEGPGWLRGQANDRLGQAVEARWKELLHVRPYQGQPAASLTGGAELNYGGLGQLTAGEIHLFLRESPQDDVSQSGRPQLRPDRMVAQRSVRLYSPQVSGAMEQWSVWFAEEPDAGVPEGSGGGGRPATGGGPARRLPEPQPAHSRPAPDPAATSLLPTGRSAWTLARQHFQIVAHSLQSRVVMRDGEFEVSDIIVTGDVHLTETRSAEPDRQPILLTGERIEVHQANLPDAWMTVTGTPQRRARFEGSDLALTGPNINVNRGTNELWVDGDGQMDLPLDRDLEGCPLPEPGRLEINWQTRMIFDGHTARFEDAVVATARHPRVKMDLHTQVMEVSLLRPIHFADPSNPADQQVERIVCRGGVSMENESSRDGMPASLDRMELADLDMNLIKGRTTAGGPGWMTSVRRGSFDLAATPAQANPGGRQHAPADADADRLYYLNVRFQGSLEGNVVNREMTFHDQVRAVYGPVDSWQATLDADDPDRLGPRGICLDCDELKVTHMPLPTGDGRTVELEAVGNLVAQGRAFTARAHRMSYAEAKDLLILEGDGWNKAELYYQERPGGPVSPFIARKISYWRSTGQIHADPRYLKISHLPGE